MTAYKAPVDDILFSIDAMGAGTLPHFDRDIAGEIARQFAGFAETRIAPLNAIGDEQGARLADGKVTLPEGFKQAFDAYRTDGWQGLTIPEAYGGQGLGALELAITSEMFIGANIALQMVASLGPGAMRTILNFGTDLQKDKLVPKLASGEWLSTMCLTEPGAGSDLSRITTRAVRDGDGWSITGEKIFISGGGHDLTDEILHLVLARTSDGGIKGLSLFACPTRNDDGSRNGVCVARIEEKMGMHASPTCQMVFDGARAELLGHEGQGLMAMFTMMNHARLDVALQGAALAGRAHQIASAYASERVQGQGKRIADHADVRRMLDEMEMLAMGGRAIVHNAYVALERGDANDLVELLTPVAKVFCTEAGSVAADTGIQVLGGYGYLREYGLEQIVRDVRIARVYEGANGIHAMALAKRLLPMGKPLDALDALVGNARPGTALSQCHEAWRTARQTMERDGDNDRMAMAFMMLTGELAHQHAWQRLADAADTHNDPERIRHLAKCAARRVGIVAAQFDAACSI